MCNCDTNLLMREGCKCNAFAEEQAKKLTGIPVIMTDYSPDNPERIPDKCSDRKQILTLPDGYEFNTAAADPWSSAGVTGVSRPVNTSVSEVSESYEQGRSYTHIQVPCDSIVWKNYLNCKDKDSLDLVINELRRHLTNA